MFSGVLSCAGTESVQQWRMTRRQLFVCFLMQLKEYQKYFAPKHYSTPKLKVLVSLHSDFFKNVVVVEHRVI